MAKDRTDIKIYICAIIVIVLQLFLGPIISINFVVPNFLLAYTIVCIVLRPDKLHLGFAFIMGMIYDLVFSGPLGAMAFAMIVFSFIISKVLIKTKIENLALSLLVIFLSVFFVELFYGVIQVATIINASMLDVLAYRVLPCTIFDAILAFVMLAIMARIIIIPESPEINSINTQNTNSRW